MPHTTNPINQFLANDTDANFRTWVAFIIDALIAAGFVQTADSGQINTATVLKPATGGVDSGYAMFRFADALQATKPVSFKLVFGSIAGQQTQPKIKLTVGTGSDGAGAVTGVLQAELTTGVLATATATAKHIFSGATGRCAMIMAYNTAQFFIFGLERMKDAAGAESGDGLQLVFGGTQATTGTFRILPFTGSIPTAEADGGAFIPTTDSMVLSGDVGVVPLKFWYFGKQVYHGNNFFLYKSSDTLSESSVDVSTYGGAAAAYMPLGNTPSPRFYINSRGTPGIMIRYN